jgi:hypothetical protein
VRRGSIALGAALCAVWAAAPAQGLTPIETSRKSEPIVLTGGELPRLIGARPERLLAFALHKSESRDLNSWHPVPIQIDERKLVDFGKVPQANVDPGVEGTVYGTPPVGVTALQYADPNTFVGPDDDPTFDSNDELVLTNNKIFRGLSARPDSQAPQGTRPGSATRIRIRDPLGSEPDTFIYLFRAKGGSAKRNDLDFVDYAFSLASGDYRQTYRRAAGPNPEDSSIHTAGYDAHFSDRWFYDRFRSRFTLNDQDLLDGYKFQFAPDSCARSEATFNAGEGAFVANIDGPIRAIRSYVGANSGPYTERTHYFYRWRHVIVTDLRVHPIPGALVYHDMNETVFDPMTYYDSVNRGGVTADGQPDTVDGTLPDWRFWTSSFTAGIEGSLWSADRVQSSFKEALLANTTGWYVDDSDPPYPQCWGDSEAIAQAGMRSTYPIPNTDPRTQPVESMRLTTTDISLPEVASPEDAVTTGDRLSAELDAPFELSAKQARLLSH